jgi:hypothetical protein
VLLSSAIAGCDVNAALERVSEARQLSADLHVQFTRAADASNRAVMADTDEASVAFAHEAEEATYPVAPCFRNVPWTSGFPSAIAMSDLGSPFPGALMSAPAAMSRSTTAE